MKELYAYIKERKHTHTHTDMQNRKIGFKMCSCSQKIAPNFHNEKESHRESWKKNDKGNNVEAR